MKYPFTTSKVSILGDAIAPTQFYLKIRDRFPESLLLESSDYHSSQKSISFVCFNHVAEIRIEDRKARLSYPDGKQEFEDICNPEAMTQCFDRFISSFDSQSEREGEWSGLFGYTSYDAVSYFEEISLKNRAHSDYKTPELCYRFFENILIFDHFYNRIHIIENKFNTSTSSRIDELLEIINSSPSPIYEFNLLGNPVSNISDEDFIQMVKKGKEVCALGETFQVVLSRQYRQQFLGDDFQVYRMLRSINPSPYLFYFDYGNYKIFGSSPEAQLVIEKERAYIDPIAGTFPRSGDDAKDANTAQKLLKDPKENAEHTMLVDLARNDLNIYCRDVRVTRFKEVQYFSHVLHLVSRVSGTISQHTSAFEVYAKTFPAGTLSGAPKHRAMQWIDKLENQSRGVYGGSIGFIGLDRQINQAITIRTFLSKNNTLFWQAGAGVVSESDEYKELQEVKNKLAALNSALQQASKKEGIIL